MVESRQKSGGVRIVLKPMGASIVVIAFAALSSLTVMSMRRDRSADGPTAAAAGLSALAGAAPTSMPKDALLPTSLDGWALDANAPAQASRTLIPDPGVPNLEKRMLRVDVGTVDPQAFWAVQFKHGIDAGIPKGTPLVLRMVARSQTSNAVDVDFLLNSGDYPTDLNAAVKLTPNWKVYAFPFTTKRDYPGGAAGVVMHVGQAVGQVDLAALQVYPADRVPAS